jgi:hypothetical protein
MHTNIALEINQLHQFFQDWFNGELTPSDEIFHRCEKVLAPNFIMVQPDGHIIQHDALLKNLRKAHQSRSDFRIWIENVQIHFSVGNVFLATYQEWQESNGDVSARQSSALFLKSNSTPNGVLWLHVHETRIKA